MASVSETAYVPEYEWDLFVSYAHLDDVPISGNKGWVTDLIDRLKPELCRRLGTKEVRIFRDGAQVSANYTLEQLLINVRRSALFLAVGSPSYVTSQWALKEVNTFAGTVHDSSRLFSIECLPPSDSYPPELNLKIRQWFWERTGERNVASTLTFESNPKLYREKLETLADDISHKLAQLKARTSSTGQPIKGTPVSAHTAGRVMGPNGKPLKKVLLAKTVGALEEELDGLRDALLQYDDQVSVVSAGDYWQVGLEFCAAFLKDLESADLFVHLLGKSPARTPPELPEGYTRFQVREAVEHKVPILQWRPPDLDLDTVQDPQYRQMLEAETVEVSGMDALRKKILYFAKNEAASPPPPSQGAVVFIDAHSLDREVAERLRKEFSGRQLEIRFPATLFAGESNMSAEEIWSDLAENLAESDVLVFLYSKASHKWIRAQLLSLSKARGAKSDTTKRDKKLEVVYIGPPPDNLDPGIYPPNVQMVTCPPNGDLEPLLKLIRDAVS